MLSAIIVALAQDVSPWHPENAVAHYRLNVSTSHEAAVSLHNDLLRIHVKAIRLRGAPESEDLQRLWAARIENPVKVPKSDNAIIYKTSNVISISAAFPSVHMNVQMNTVREDPSSYSTYPPLPPDSEAMAEAILRESYARFVGSTLDSAPGITLGGRNFSRSKSRRSGAEYVPLKAFAQAVGGTINENDETLRFTLNKGNRVFQFAWGTPYAKMGGGWEKLPDGVALRDGQLWIPLAAAQRFVGNTNE